MIDEWGSEDKIYERQKKIDASELQLGQYVARLSSPWSQTPFLIQGFVVADESERQWIKSHCEWVVIDLTRSQANEDVAEVLSHFHIVDKDNVLIDQPFTAQSLKASLNKYLDLNKNALRIIDQLKGEEPLELRDAILSVLDVAKTLGDHLPALVWLTRIKHEDQYTAEHCLNVSVLAMGLATSLGWSPQKTAQVGVAGLLHDLGKIDIDNSLLNKPGRLSAEEFEVMKTHPEKGFQRLHDEPDLTGPILDGILNHHERPDGKGYPKGISGDKISDIAKVVAIVDAYDAITSDRVYQKARSHHEAMSILWRMRDAQFDSEFVEAFIHFLGWVTPGTLVELSSGDIAIVIQATEGQRLYPNVRILMPTNVGYSLGALWRLAEMPAPTGEPKIHIANVLPDGYLGIKIENYADHLFD